MLLTVAVMMAASASPAFAQEDIFVPPNAIKGLVVSEFAQEVPPNPIKGLTVSRFVLSFD